MQPDARSRSLSFTCSRLAPGDLRAASAYTMLHWTDRLAEPGLRGGAGTASAKAGSATHTNLCQTSSSAAGSGPPQAAAMVRTLGGGFLLPVAVFTYSLKVGRLSQHVDSCIPPRTSLQLSLTDRSPSNGLPQGARLRCKSNGLDRTPSNLHNIGSHACLSTNVQHG